jgi:hypothetical protein
MKLIILFAICHTIDALISVYLELENIDKNQLNRIDVRFDSI